MATLQNGAVLENTYEIIKEIGSGGSGIIFLGETSRAAGGCGGQND